ncbi:Druantia anti-phage system protein DruA [Mesorhizobium sp. M0207]|uniref:Druantia anti-phage system protein DruA n=1 Tax=Mesorhizobium sp. M0207 TaxID=2956915 RepID=UPI0033370EA8
MYRSIVVDEQGKSSDVSAVAAFVNALASDLKAFGRDDVALISVGGLKVFVWDPVVASSGSAELREAAMAHRLNGQKALLTQLEAELPQGFFNPFDVNLADVLPEIVVCTNSADAQLFDYVVWGQSMSADTRNFRNTKVLVFDATPEPRRLMGAILLKSPMYFGGARDAYLGWPELVETVDGQRRKNQAAIDLRNKALKSIYNVGVCMLVPPYTAHGMGKLIASLCFSPEIIDHLEGTFGQPVLGMTTTGGWGGNATQYDRLNIADRAGGGKRALFTRVRGARASLHFPTQLFSDTVFQRAIDVIRADNTVRIRDFAGHDTDPAVAIRVFRQTCKLIGIPFRATAANCVAHYFGSVSDACTDALRTNAGIDVPPPVRSIPIADALAEWRRRQRIANSDLRRVSAIPLSRMAT